MTEPIVFRKTFAIVALTLLQAAMPPAVAVGMLYLMVQLYDVNFSRQFVVLCAFVATLSMVLLQPPRNLGEQLVVRRWPMAISIILRWGVLLGILLTVGYATQFSEDFSRLVIFTWAMLTPGVLILSALLLQEVLRRLLYDPSAARRVVFAGYNEGSASLAERLRKNPELCMTAHGFFDDRSAERLGLNGNIELLGRLSDLAGYVKRNRVDVIFIALPIRHVQRVMDLLDDLRDTTASIYYIPDVFVFDLIQARTGEIMGIPVVAMCETPFYGYRGVIKRMTDILISLAGLVATAPVMLVIMTLIKLSSPGPAIFKQRRYGLDGGEFTVYKFRTMTVAEDGDKVVQAKRNDARTTPIGRLLRRYSLDELPQLVNVLQGRMSLVGPRPHAVAHNEEYRKLIKGYMIRHKVLPGITGLAQINGCRGETARLEDMQARVAYDLDYLRQWTPLLDLKILFQTAVNMFRDDKAY